MEVVMRGEPPGWEASDGYGSGYGSGSGDGDGSGSGSGSGYGDGYWAAFIPGFAAKWQPAQRARLAELEKAGAIIAYWRSDKDGRASNGGRNDPVGPGTVEKIAGPLQLCTSRALHATLKPEKWKGERWWIVALIGEVAKDDDKMGALQREIIGECL